MQPAFDIRFDVASAISQGRRPHQEDALVADFPLGSEVGFVVLADGMGGHAAGDVASKIVVTEVFSELKLQSGDVAALAANLPEILRSAAFAANDCVKHHIQGHAETAGMGATLVAPVLVGTRLYWISVGDSPLFLYRDGDLRQLNEDHSMSPQIDFMIRSGLLTEEAGRDHPDRNCLTSVLGGDEIARIDCPAEPLEMRDGDVLLVASDGIQYLASDEIARIIGRHLDKPSRAIADRLLCELEAFGDPEQDNASFSVIKIACRPAAGRRRGSARRAGGAAPRADALVDDGVQALAAVEAPSRFKPAVFFRRASFFRSSAQ